MINDQDIKLVLGRNSFGLLSQEDDPWIRYSFDILLGEEDGPGRVVGSMQASKLSYGEVSRRRLPLGLAFDDFSMEASECYDVLFTKKGNLRKSFWHEEYALEEYFARDFHLLERIEVNENFKSNGISGIATRIYLENFANSDDVAYLKAYPLQHESRFGDKPYNREFRGDFKASQAKLCRYYEHLGFRRIGKTEHFFFVVDHFLSHGKD
jgi:hypothetical protein